MSLIYTQKMIDAKSRFTIKEILGEERYLEFMCKFHDIKYKKMVQKSSFINKK